MTNTRRYKMQNDINLKKIEDKAYKTYQQDGLWDIALGFFFLSFGISILTEIAWALAICIPALAAAYANFRKSLIGRRLGYAKFGPERQAQEKTGRIIFLIAMFVSLFAGVLVSFAYSNSSPLALFIRKLELLPFGAVLTMVVIAGGSILQMRRFIVYGILIMVVFLASFFVNSDPAACFLLLGIIFLLSGVTILIRFLRRYPKQKDLTDGTEILG
jgi:hypothetical protein